MFVVGEKVGELGYETISGKEAMFYFSCWVWIKACRRLNNLKKPIMRPIHGNQTWSSIQICEIRGLIARVEKEMSMKMCLLVW